MEQEWKHIGYLKSISLLKVFEWLKQEDILYLRARRERKMSSSLSTPSGTPSYIKMIEESRRFGEIEFNKSAHGAIDIDSIVSFVLDKLGGFMYIDELIYIIKDPVGELARYKEDNKKYGPIVAIFKPGKHPPKESAKDQGFREMIRKLNNEEMTKGGLSYIATLDLVKLQHGSVLKRKLPYEIPSREKPVSSEPNLVKAAMLPFRVDSTWKSIRSYLRTKEAAWKLTSY